MRRGIAARLCRHGSLGPVICAIDFDDLAPQLISAARTLARRTGADVRVVHVVTPAAGDNRSDEPTRSAGSCCRKRAPKQHETIPLATAAAPTRQGSMSPRRIA